MEQKAPGPSKGYQKQIKKDAQPPAKPKRDSNAPLDYSSPAAKKWPKLIEAIRSGNAGEVRQLIEEGINVNILRDGVTPLMIAAAQGQTEIADVIIQAGVNVNERSDDGWTALHKAAFDQAGTGIIELLLQYGIDSEALNGAGKTALKLAEEKGHRDIIRVIKKHQQQAQIDAKEWEKFLTSPEGKPYQKKRQYDSLATVFKFWWLPFLVFGSSGLLVGFLFGAVFLSGIIGMVSGLLVSSSIYFLEKNLRNYLDHIGPLPYLDIQTLRLKKKSGEPITIEENNEIPPAEETPDGQSAIASETVALGTLAGQTTENGLIGGSDNEEGIVPETKGSLKIVNYALLVLVFAVLISGALYSNKDSLAKWYFTVKLKEKGIPASGQAFLAEVSKNNAEALELFIKAGIPLDAVNEQGQTAIMIASEKGYVDILKTLVKSNPALLKRVDKDGNTALMIASRLGQEKSVSVLCENGAEVNFTASTKDGAATALQTALDVPDFREEHFRIVQYLLQRGADVKGKNAEGQSPLLFAADRGRAEAASVLIENGADMNDADKKGIFPLLSAACKGHADVVALLLEKGANMNLALPDGHTPLMCAARAGHVETIKVLLEKGARVDAKTVSGATALTEATSGGRVAVAKMLLEQGADPGTGSVPDSFTTLSGSLVAVSAKRNTIRNVLGRIAKAASQDGYTISLDSKKEQKMNFSARGPWNKVLHELADKNHLLLVVKDKEITLLPYARTAIKREAM